MKVEILDLSKSFGKKQVLSGLSLSARGGQKIGILGENGSGKSTLFSVLTGLLKGSGSFMLDGTDLMSDSKKRTKVVGFVPQSPPLIRELSARDNLRLWYSAAQIKNECENGTLKMLGIDEFLSVSVGKMSGGMKKRLAIACAIAHKPKVLLLDEPTSALDIVCKEQIYRYLDGFAASGGIVLMATHDVYELSFCDEVYVLKNGKLMPFTDEKTLEKLMGALQDA